MEIISVDQLLKFAAALVFVLCLMGLLALIMRRVNQGGGAMPLSRKRLKIVEALPLDSRRRLVIIRRDDREHLVILGTNSETVIESGFESPQNEPRTAEQQKAA